MILFPLKVNINKVRIKIHDDFYTKIKINIYIIFKSYFVLCILFSLLNLAKLLLVRPIQLMRKI